MFVTLSLFSSIRLFFCSPTVNADIAQQPIDQAWWDGLSEEWKTIFRINQYFQKHDINFLKIQEEYLNRLNGPDDEPISEINTSLRSLKEKQTFLLSYPDMYARVHKKFADKAEDSIDLKTLQLLDRIYMVSGPGDLSPLSNFSNLKVVIINYCGIDHGKPFSDQILDLEPLRRAKKLTHLYCSSPTLRSLDPLSELTNLRVLECYNTEISSLEPLKNLSQLETLSVGSKVKKLSIITRLSNLQDLTISGFRQMPDFSNLKNLKKLTLIENELALVDKAYQLNNLSFLERCSSLEFLDFELSSYRGNLEELKNLTKLKAITLPRVSRMSIPSFKQTHPSCKIINDYEFE